MFGTFSHAPELIIILIIALVIFGPKKLPHLGKGLGEGIREFKKATSGDADKEEEDAGAATVTSVSTATPPVVEAPKTSTDTTSASPAAKPPAAAEHKA